MDIDIFFLGTGQAVPTARRNHTSVLLRYKNENILFDCGEGTQRQLRKAGLNPCSITKIFISHWHGDHVLGLLGMFQTMALSGYNKTLEVYGPVGTKTYLERLMHAFVFVRDFKVNIKEIRNEYEIPFGDFIVDVYKLNHTIPCLGYRFVEKDKVRIEKKKLKKYGLKQGPVIGELKRGEKLKIKGRIVTIKDISYVQKGKVIGLIFDTALADNCYKIARNADLLISESTYLDDLKDKAKEYKHLTNVQAAEVARKANACKLALIHVSQRHELDDKKIIAGARKVFKNTILTEDLMKIEV